MTTASFAPAFDIPALWDHARRLLADVLARFGEPEALAEQRRMRRKDQFAIRAWLAPVELITRGLIAVAAATRLMMTPEGQRLLRATQKILPPSGPRPFPPSHKLTVAAPGWATIAKRWAPEPDPEPIPELPPPDPARNVFRGLGWSFPDRTPKPPLPLAFRTLLLSLDADRATQPPRIGQPHTHEAPVVIHLARRLAALRRVLARPEPTIRRFMRFLARLPKGVLDADGLDAWTASHRWPHGGDAYRALNHHARCLLRRFESSG